MKLLKAILESDQDIEAFNILTFNVGAAWVEPEGWLPNTAGRPRNRLRAARRARPGRRHRPRRRPGQAGQARLRGGRRHADQRVSCCPTARSPGAKPMPRRWCRASSGVVRCNCRFHCYRTGLGAENLELFEALTRRGGGIFNCFSEADLTAAAVAHRQECLTDEHAFVSSAVPPPATSSWPAARPPSIPAANWSSPLSFSQPGRTTLMVEGTVPGQEVRRGVSRRSQPGTANWRPRAGPRSPWPRCWLSTIRSSTAW